MIEQFSRNSMTIVNKYSPYLEFINLSSKIMTIYEMIDESANIFTVYSYAPGEFSSSYFDHTEVFSKYKERKLHRHNFYEIIYVIDGTFKQEIEGDTYILERGDCCILNSNTAHRESFSGQYKAIFLLVSREFLDELSQHLDSSEKKNFYSELFEMYKREKKTIHFYKKEFVNYIVSSSTTNLHPIEQIIDSILLQISLNTEGSELIIKGLFLQFLSFLETKRNYNKQISSFESSNDELLFIKIIFLLEKSTSSITRENLSAILGYNSDYINRVLKKFCGLTFIQLKHMFFLSEIEHLLASTTIPISKIAEMYGFSNRTHFYKIFRKKNHMSPLDYRKKYQQNLL